MAKLELSSQERSAFRAQAHPLKPVVLLGDAGLTPAVLAEINRALTAHELIKIKARGEERAARELILDQICDELEAAPIHHLGKILTVYRPKPIVYARTSANYERKGNDKYIPKKLAAEGRTKPTRKAVRIDPKLGNAGLAGKPNRSALGRAFFAAPAQRADISDRQSRDLPKRGSQTPEGQYIPRRAAMQEQVRSSRGGMSASARGTRPPEFDEDQAPQKPVRVTGLVAGKGEGKVLKVDGGYVVAGQFVPSLSNRIPRPGTSPRKPAAKRADARTGDRATEQRGAPRKSSAAPTGRAPSKRPARKTSSR